VKLRRMNRIASLIAIATAAVTLASAAGQAVTWTDGGVAKSASW
jgi:hypothetical protein